MVIEMDVAGPALLSFFVTGAAGVDAVGHDVLEPRHAGGVAGVLVGWDAHGGETIGVAVIDARCFRVRAVVVGLPADRVHGTVAGGDGCFRIAYVP